MNRYITGLLLCMAIMQAEAGTPNRAIDAYLDPLLGDGFDFPVGDKDGKGCYRDPKGTKHCGWYVATITGEEYSLGIHTGEDWNGKGGGDSDIGQPVYAIAKGKCIDSKNYGGSWGNVVVIAHKYLENGAVHTVFSVYAHLASRAIKKGETVSRREQIGVIGNADGMHKAHLHIEIRKESLEGYPSDYWPSSYGKSVEWVTKNYWDVSRFIEEHRTQTVPAQEKKIVIGFKSENDLFVLENGTIAKQIPFGTGQNSRGHKQKEGDNRTPEGEYRIIQKARPPFSGAYAAYFGAAWMRINYPNNWDAQRGFEKGLISQKQRDQIIAQNKKGVMPLKNTNLGGGIGIHGWIDEWIDDGSQNRTWGCITLQNSELDILFDELRLQTKVIIQP